MDLEPKAQGRGHPGALLLDTPMVMQPARSTLLTGPGVGPKGTGRAVPSL
jgi:hypothetical protein